MISRGADTEVNSTVSSASATDSTLPDSWGTSINLVSVGMSWGVDRVICVAVVAMLFPFWTSCSFCQILQLRFSSLRPCSTDSAQREKTALVGLAGWLGGEQLMRQCLPVHML